MGTARNREIHYKMVGFVATNIYKSQQSALTCGLEMRRKGHIFIYFCSQTVKTIDFKIEISIWKETM